MKQGLPTTLTTHVAPTYTMNSSSLLYLARLITLLNCLYRQRLEAGDYYHFKVPITAAADVGKLTGLLHTKYD